MTAICTRTVFLIPATLIFHAANLADPAQAQQQVVEVLKNLAILGALVKFAADGAGAYSLDNRLATRDGKIGTAASAWAEPERAV